MSQISIIYKILQLLMLEEMKFKHKQMIFSEVKFYEENTISVLSYC